MATDRYIVKGKDTSFLPFSASTDGFHFALPIGVNLRKERVCSRAIHAPLIPFLNDRLSLAKTRL